MLKKCENHTNVQKSKIWAVDINIHACESMIVVLRVVIKIFTVPDSDSLAVVQVTESWVRKYERWRIPFVAWQVVPSPRAQLNQCRRGIHDFVSRI